MLVCRDVNVDGQGTDSTRWVGRSGRRSCDHRWPWHRQTVGAACGNAARNGSHYPRCKGLLTDTVEASGRRRYARGAGRASDSGMAARGIRMDSARCDAASEPEQNSPTAAERMLLLPRAASADAGTRRQPWERVQCCSAGEPRRMAEEGRRRRRRREGWSCCQEG